MAGDKKYSTSIFIVAITLVVAVLVLSYGYSIVQELAVAEDVDEEVREHLVAIYGEDASFSEFEYEGEVFYAAREAGDTIGVAHTGSGSGYGGDIYVLTGIDRTGEIVGIAVKDHQETPDLGDRVEDDDFRERFVGLALNDPIEIGDDVSGLTGATVSAEGVAEAVRSSVQKAFDAMQSGEY